MLRHRALLVSLAVLGLHTLAPAQRFRVVTANLWYSGTRGFNSSTGAYPLGHQTSWPGIKAALKWRVSSGYGILGLQEVYWKTKSTGFLDSPADLKAHLGYGWSHRFGATQASDGGFVGNAALTNARIVKEQAWRFAFNPQSTDYGSRPRGAQALKLDFEGKRLWFVNTHLEPSNSVALAQVFQLLGKVKTFDPDTPVLVVGDLNIMNGTGLSPTEKTFLLMDAAFSAAGFVDVSAKKPTRLPGATQGSALADGQIDFIYLYDRHDRLKTRSCWSGRLGYGPLVFSDHLAVVAEFEWR